MSNNYLTDLKAAQQQREQWRRQGERVVFTNGCFDLLHPGHVTYLEDARAMGDHLIVGLNSDESIRRLKGENRPVNRLADRAHMLMALRAVDMVVSFSEDTPIGLITALLPDLLVKGGDYQPDEIVGAAEVRANGGEVRVVPFMGGYSSTTLINRICELHQ